MPRLPKIMSLCAIVGVLLLALSGCVSDHIIYIPKDFQMTAPEIREKIPLQTGLYFRTSSMPLALPPPPSRPIILIYFEDALRSSIHKMLQNVFTEVTFVDQESRIDSGIVVTPELLSMGIENRRVDGKFPFRMDIRWNILSPDGKILYVNTIKSEVWAKIAAGTRTEDYKAGFAMLINDQTLKAQNDIYSSKWWEKQWWKEIGKSPNQHQ